MAKKTLKLDKDLNLNVKHCDFYLEHTPSEAQHRCMLFTQNEIASQVIPEPESFQYALFFLHPIRPLFSPCPSHFLFQTSDGEFPLLCFLPPPCWHEPTPDTKECCRWEQSQVLWRSDSALHNLNSPIFFPPSCCRICAWSTHFSNKILRIKIGRRKKKNGLQSVMK